MGKRGRVRRGQPRAAQELWLDGRPQLFALGLPSLTETTVGLWEVATTGWRVLALRELNGRQRDRPLVTQPRVKSATTPGCSESISQTVGLRDSVSVQAVLAVSSVSAVLVWIVCRKPAWKASRLHYVCTKSVSQHTVDS